MIVIFFYIIYELFSLFVVFWKGNYYEFILWFNIIFISLFESIANILIKNLMEIKLFSPFKICYLIGSINLIILIIILPILCVIKCNSKLPFCEGDEPFFGLFSLYINNNKNIRKVSISISFVLILLISGINKYIINSVLNKYNIFYLLPFYQINALDIPFFYFIFPENKKIDNHISILINISNFFLLLVIL